MTTLLILAMVKMGRKKKGVVAVRREGCMK